VKTVVWIYGASMLLFQLAFFGCGGPASGADAGPLADLAEAGDSTDAGTASATDAAPDALEMGDANAADVRDAAPTPVCVKGQSDCVIPGTGPLACGTDAGEDCLVTCGDDGQWASAVVCASCTFKACFCPDADSTCTSTGTYPCDTCSP